MAGSHQTNPEVVHTPSAILSNDLWRRDALKLPDSDHAGPFSRRDTMRKVECYERSESLEWSVVRVVLNAVKMYLYLHT